MTESKGYRNPLVGRIAQVLDYLARNEAALPAIVRDLGLPKTSAYVLLQSLLDVGYVRLLPNGKTYALGFKLYEIGTLAAGRINLRDLAMPHLVELRDAIDLTCHLGCLDGMEAFYLIKLQPTNNNLQINSWEGKRISLYSSGVGKVLLAWQPPEEQTRIVSQLHMEAITPHTITCPDVLLNHLADIRRRMWAMDNEEDGLGIRCVAMPVFSVDGRVSAAVSASGPLQQIDGDMTGLLKVLNRAARAITAALGGSYPPPRDIGAVQV